MLYSRRAAPFTELGSHCTAISLRASPPLWHARVGRDANRRCDVFLSTNSYLTPLALRIPSAVMVYDLIAFEAFRHAHPRARLNERASLRAAVRRAERLICISQATRRDLVTRFPKAGEKSTVVHLGASERFRQLVPTSRLAAVRARYGLQRRFVLAVGTLEPRKNLPRLIEAYAGLPEHLRRAHELVLVGPKGWAVKETTSALEAHESEVRALGWLPDEDLAALYQDCEVFCYPSLYEGFGLPLLEAMSAGAAAIASPVSSLPEIGEDAVAYADPTKVSDLRAELRKLLESPVRRRTLGEAARRRAAAFTWERTGSAIIAELARLGRSAVKS